METSDELFIMMEYAEGGSLWDLLSGPVELPFARRLEVALDAARGLLYLHTCKPQVLHRDIKGCDTARTLAAAWAYSVLQAVPEPSACACRNNVLIGASGIAKLTDFGLSMIMANHAATIDPAATGTSHPHTERWAAPEVLEGGQVDEKADVYSFAMLLFEIFAKAVSCCVPLSAGQT